MSKTTTQTKGIACVLEVWHGGIPDNAPALPLCLASYGCLISSGAHSHTQRISDKPFSISWADWIKYHMDVPPTLVLHIYAANAR